MDSETDSAADLERRIRASIPLAEAMQFHIEALQARAIEVSAPLPPNVNIHGTGFAGSIYSVAVLAGWALCSHLLETAKIDADLVVASAEIRYRSPVTETLVCSAAADAGQHRAFIDGVRTAGKGVITLEIRVGNRHSATLSARYCALARQS